MSKRENAKTARVLRDDELDAVSGGKVMMQDIHFGRSAGSIAADGRDLLISSYSWGQGWPAMVAFGS
jgi:hypothetical protein